MGELNAKVESNNTLLGHMMASTILQTIMIKIKNE